MHQTSTISLHVRHTDDLLLKSGILFSGHHLLDPVVENFLIEEAEALPVNGTITVVIYTEQKEAAPEKKISEALLSHFMHQSRKAEQKVKEILALGWKFLLLGFVFLAIMFFIAFAITTFLPENAFMITLKELFIILGWVALWRPADLLLYEWRSCKRKSKLLVRLANSKVVFQ